jgi:two-component system, cell cycle response regulator DivK
VSKRVLVIEDEEDNRRIVRDLLTSVGYEIIEAVTGETGVTAASTHLPDLILIVTSYALSGDDVKAFAAGCDAYVTKPFSPRALLAKVREYLP